MGKFNEIQNGLPCLGNTYWKDLKNSSKDSTTLSDIVNLNCQTNFTLKFPLIC